jgi:hypothetical protein
MVSIDPNTGSGIFGVELKRPFVAKPFVTASHTGLNNSGGDIVKSVEPMAISDRYIAIAVYCNLDQLPANNLVQVNWIGFAK